MSTIKDMTLEDVKSVITEVVKDTLGSEVSAKIAEQMEKQPERRYMHSADNSEIKSVKGIKAAQMLRYFALSEGNLTKASEIADKEGNTEAAKLLTASDFASGGALITENIYDEIIALLEPETVMRSSGVQVLPLVGGNVSMTREDQGPTAYYTGESEDIVTTDAKFGQMKFTEKELNIMIPISDKLLRNGGPKVEQFIRNKMIQRMAIKEDQQFLRGAGGEFAPKGLKYWITDDMKVPMTDDSGSVTIATITKDLLSAINRIRRTDVKLTKGVWVFNSTVYTYLMSVRDGNGNLVFAPEMVGGTLFGFPFKVTSQIPYDIGGDKSEVYLFDAQYAHIFDVPGMELSVSREASYMDGSTLRSTFSRNETLIKMTARHDFGLTHATAATMITDVEWNFD